MVNLAELLSQALGQHQVGHLHEAEQIYRRILEENPQHANAWHLLGVVAHQTGKPDVAVEYIGRAIGLNEPQAMFHSNLGNALKDLGKLDEAVACYRRALELNPSYVDACYNLAIALKGQGKLDEAIAAYRRALELQPSFAEAHNNLGVALVGQGELDEAVASYRRAVELKPDFAGAHNNLSGALREQGKPGEAEASCRRALELHPDYAEAHNYLGVALGDQGKWDEAIAAYGRALELKPNYAEAHNNLGMALAGQRMRDEAIASYRRALELRPRFSDAHSNLGNVLRDLGDLDGAIAAYQEALKLDPENAVAHNNLGNALKDQGELDQAIACFRRALELKPDYSHAHSNWVYTLHLCPDVGAAAILEEHRCWDQRHAEPLTRSVAPHTNVRDPDRRLRVGYVSPDFRSHPIARFILPLLELHNRAEFEVVCYADVRVPDALTDRCRAVANVWRDVQGRSDQQVADLVRQDGIDILVDLAMHTADNRLLTFARKPAPVQVTYLAYCGTTGLRTMDYRLTDPYLDHDPNQAAQDYSEESVWLPETYWCYRLPFAVPSEGELPALRNGYVTFGCLNNSCKMSDVALDAWSRVLRKLPQSRLLLHAPAGSHRERVRSDFAKRGVSPERITFAAKLPIANYFELYRQIDVALDPFPYGGGTTTCDALWMGVPVVSLAGQTAVGRGGLSILSNAGLPELVALNVDDYVALAAELASDLPRLQELRAGLRTRLQSSLLLDAPRFTRNVEAAFRTMWKRWCAAPICLMDY